MSMKIPMTPSEIEPATFRFVAQCLTTVLPRTYTMGTGSFPEVKWPKEGVVFDHPRPSNAEVKERVELYLYSLSGFAWPVLG